MEAIIEVWRRNPVHNHGLKYWSEVVRCQESNAIKTMAEIAAIYELPTRIRPR